MNELEEYRKSIDNIDNAIISMFAERFKVTNKVGEFKAKNALPAKDEAREQKQFLRIVELANTYGLDAEFAKAMLTTVIGNVVENHKKIANK
ncbi:MAG: chorismate mutase [Saccharospirillaceae bacterium]|nr:chorismate mutase [Saccharospirillaceae bacterium]